RPALWSPKSPAPQRADVPLTDKCSVGDQPFEVVMDRFRKEYRQLNDEEKALCLKIKETATKMEALLLTDLGREEIDPDDYLRERARATALARTKLEESVMWAIKAITG